MSIRAVLALVLAAFGLAVVGPLSPASATAAQAYPPTTCPTLAVSTTKPAVGETITVTGTRFDPNQRVTLILNTKTFVLAHVTTGDQGGFSVGVTMPAGLTGDHVISVRGAQSVCPADPIQLSIQGPPATAPATSGDNPPAVTGTDVLELLAAAAALIGLGVLLNRRRRPAKARSHSR